jgi:hypothetical protein
VLHQVEELERTAVAAVLFAFLGDERDRGDLRLARVVGCLLAPTVEPSAPEESRSDDDSDRTGVQRLERFPNLRGGRPPDDHSAVDGAGVEAVAS